MLPIKGSWQVSKLQIEKTRVLCILVRGRMAEEVKAWSWKQVNTCEGYDQVIWTIRSKQKKRTCGFSRGKAKSWLTEAYHISGITLVEQVYSELRCRLVEEHSHSMHNPWTISTTTNTTVSLYIVQCTCVRRANSEMSLISITHRSKREPFNLLEME